LDDVEQDQAVLPHEGSADAPPQPVAVTHPDVAVVRDLVRRTTDDGPPGKSVIGWEA
jgi:hypothetical protein